MWRTDSTVGNSAIHSRYSGFGDHFVQLIPDPSKCRLRDHHAFVRPPCQRLGQNHGPSDGLFAPRDHAHLRRGKTGDELRPGDVQALESVAESGGVLTRTAWHVDVQIDAIQQRTRDLRQVRVNVRRRSEQLPLGPGRLEDVGQAGTEYAYQYSCSDTPTHASMSHFSKQGGSDLSQAEVGILPDSESGGPVDARFITYSMSQLPPSPFPVPPSFSYMMTATYLMR